MSIVNTARPHITASVRTFLSLPASLRTFAFTSVARKQPSHRSVLDAQTRSNGFSPMSGKDEDGLPVPSPSSSVLLISPNNHILLLQRVKQSSSFASAHVFPGGNVSPFHDGEMPGVDSPERHVDSDVYRMAAIRETFEESGILLARNNGFGRLIEVPEEEREAGRKLVHGDKIPFTQWLAKKGGRADLKGLVPFTRWVTPNNVPKRFTTQMYLYFLPTLANTPLEASQQTNASGAAAEILEPEVSIPVPTTDGGIEHTNARFLPASVWLRLAQESRILLFPPQFFLLHQVAQYLDNLPSPTAYGSISQEQTHRAELERRRNRLLEFVRSGDPPWTEKCISPNLLSQRDGNPRDDGRVVLGLNKPGVELQQANSGRKGVADQCVLVEFRKQGPRRLAVVSREEGITNGPKL